MNAVLKVLADNHESYLRDLAEFVAIPSVSTDPAHQSDVQRAAGWVAPAACAKQVQSKSSNGRRRIIPLFLDAGTAHPAHPTVLDLRPHGRTAPRPPHRAMALTALHPHRSKRTALRPWRSATTRLPCCCPSWRQKHSFWPERNHPVNLRFIFEAEEEIGSVNLPLLVRERARCAGLRRRLIGRWWHVEA